MKIQSLFIILALALLMGAWAEDMPQAVDELRAVEVIEDEAAVREAQQVLIDLGLLLGPADGKAGPATASALQAFQATRDLEATGVLDPATWTALKQALPMPVKEVQQRLIDLGYLSGSADGQWGERSKAALSLFQRLHDLKVTGIIDAASVERLSTGRSLPPAVSSGEQGDQVLALQQRLIRFGFMAGQADGKYGKTTQEAVRALQRHLRQQGLAQRYGVEVTGEATRVTMFLLTDPDYSVYLTDLTPGDAGEEVMRVTSRLSSLGYMDLMNPSTLDDYAMEALALFRERAGIEGGDVIDKTDIDHLFGEDAPGADHCVPHDIALGDSGLVVREVEAALNTSGMTILLPDGLYDEDMTYAVGRLRDTLQKTGDDRASLFADTARLSRQAVTRLLEDLPGYVADVGAGQDGGPETLRVQRRLHTLYYLDHNNVDGKFGEKSRVALMEFQNANALPPTGLANRATQEKLFSDEARKKKLRYRLQVSIADQMVEAYKLNDAGEYDLVATFVCSTGLNNSTPRGIFLDGFPVNRWHHFTEFNCWAQYSYDIEGDIMFHSVLYTSDSEDSLRVSSVNNLGGPASHGCIRLEVEAAKWIFDHCEQGSTVIVID